MSTDGVCVYLGVCVNPQCVVRGMEVGFIL